MPCDTKLKQGQTIQQRAEEVRAATARLAADLAAGRVKPKVGANGAVVFEGWAAQSRDNVTDNCAYRRLMAGTSTLAKLAIQRAEQLAGRSVDRRVVNSGVHSHDGGKTWHKH
jgi:hypothetical protein